MIASNLIDAEVGVRSITLHDPSSAFFKLCFRLLEWSKCFATHNYSLATITAVTVACAPGTSLLSHFVLDYARLLSLTSKYTEKTVESKTGNKQCLPWSPISAFDALIHNPRP
ncbi:hypothetical protein PoB_001665500 [Plakobranchus ocellatus]|uniref:Uncharacterized protein n=1 Tax=Plakobranchus ocellatus TaxID=259542 RepID=A0AAV3Z4S1_9GAST|nr:hypothetical protein PoB_001665500 [Plakobranchus ocellatus]